MPQRRRNVELKHLDALVELSGRAAADDYAGHRWVSHRKLNGCCFQRHTVPGANITYSAGSVDELGGRGLGGLVGARVWGGKGAAVVDAAGGGRRPPLFRFRNRPPPGELVQQGVRALPQEGTQIP